MNITLVSKRGRIYDEGNERLKYKIVVPSIEGCERINRFFLDIAEECESFCRERLAKELEQKGYYELCCALTHADEKSVAIVMRAGLSCAGGARESFTWAGCWSVERQLMIPPRALLKKYAPKGKRKNTQGIFLCEGEIRSLYEVDIDAFFRKKG